LAEYRSLYGYSHVATSRARSGGQAVLLGCFQSGKRKSRVPATCFRLRKGFAVPDVVEFKPVRARRPHRSVRPKLLNIKGLDRRTAARKAFDALVAEIEHDLGGREHLSAIGKSLIQAYAGSAILLDDLNARVVLGQEIDVGTHAQMTSALVRIASRLGLQRRRRDVTPTVEEYLRSKRQELPS
jgi:hypothetical protein